jgi:hypothetical protein
MADIRLTESVPITSQYESQLLALVSSVCQGRSATWNCNSCECQRMCCCIDMCTCPRPDVWEESIFCEKYISTNKFKLEATGSSFGDGHSWHVALPGTQLPLLINEIEEIVVAVNLTKWWKDDEPLRSKVTLTKSTVTECGISSEKIPLSKEMTPFSVPGDSCFEQRRRNFGRCSGDSTTGTIWRVLRLWFCLSGSSPIG